MAIAKKHWVPVLAPKQFKSEPLGESYVLETDSLQGRGITVNLMNLNTDLRKQNLNLSFRINSVKEGKANTRITGVAMQPSSIKRLVRRGRSKLEDSFLIKLKNNQVARIKPLIITKTNAPNSSAAALRTRCRELATELAVQMNFESLVNDVVTLKLQRYLRAELSKVFPVRSVDVRVCSLQPRFALDAEGDVEESTYNVIEESRDETDGS